MAVPPVHGYGLGRAHHAGLQGRDLLHLQGQLVELHLALAALRLQLAPQAGGNIGEVTSEQALDHAVHPLRQRSKSRHKCQGTQPRGRLHSTMKGKITGNLRSSRRKALRHADTPPTKAFTILYRHIHTPACWNQQTAVRVFAGGA